MKVISCAFWRSNPIGTSARSAQNRVSFPLPFSQTHLLCHIPFTMHASEAISSWSRTWFRLEIASRNWTPVGTRRFTGQVEADTWSASRYWLWLVLEDMCWRVRTCWVILVCTELPGEVTPMCSNCSLSTMKPLPLNSIY